MAEKLLNFVKFKYKNLPKRRACLLPFKLQTTCTLAECVNMGAVCQQTCAKTVGNSVNLHKCSVYI